LAASFLGLGGFALAVMVLDRANRSLPSDAGYVALVMGAGAAVYVAAAGFRAYRVRKRIALALRDPLYAELPAASPGPEGAWKELVEACRAEARRAAAARDTAARGELDAFVASVHELKTPATALSLMVQRAFADGLRLPAEEVGLEADALSRSIDRALGRLRLADFEAGSRITRIDAAAAARESVRRHKRMLISRGIGVEVGGEAAVETDGTWLAFILDQLVSNAAKYAASRILVSVGREGRLSWIEVEDDGPGMDAEDLLRAGSKSASGSAGSRRGSAPGPASSGYGLYLASEAARRLGLGLEIGGGARGSAGDRARGTVARLVLPLAAGPLDQLT
jgi:signal transduction histidine kinase